VLVASRLTIRGSVQGVLYRDWTVANARMLGLAGWVRNLQDKTVAAHLEGEEAAVQAMVERMWQGPPEARVEQIEQVAVEPEGLPDFGRR